VLTPLRNLAERAAIYCRVSSHEQKTKGDLERQVGRMTTEALKRGYNIVAVFDEGRVRESMQTQEITEII